MPLGGWRFTTREAGATAAEDGAYVPLQTLQILRDAVCFNQGAFSQYWYLASELHKELKNELHKPIRDQLRLKSCRDHLTNELNNRFFEAATKNFDFLHRFYKGRSKTPPRICIKGYFKTSDRDRIITVLRDRPYPEGLGTIMGENTGFSSVANTGKYFICNDLVEATANGLYKNPRLNDAEVKSSSWLSRKLNVSRHWSSYWTSSSGSGKNESYYTSTLITPMTFWNSEVDPRFLKPLESLPDQKRTILGFLCFDHVEKNYFDEELDVSISYMIADFLCMFLFARQVFMDLSTSYQSAEKSLQQESSTEFDIEHLRTLIEQIGNQSQGPESVRDIQASSIDQNNIVRLDSLLATYSGRISKETDLVSCSDP
ncbi:MAG: hypothetical protein EOP06_10635 [Proteobacteria bacterium]|nr:MAG: hypothetical protein EOP06_10635 [Pseudomonadota bacterium]